GQTMKSKGTVSPWMPRRRRIDRSQALHLVAAIFHSASMSPAMYLTPHWSSKVTKQCGHFMAPIVDPGQQRLEVKKLPRALLPSLRFHRRLHCGKRVTT